MRTKYNEGSAWGFLFKIAGCIVLFFLLPYLALKNSDDIDRWGDSMDGQLVVFWVVIVITGSYGITWFWNRIKRKLKEG